MLDTIREYGYEQLEASGEADATLQAFAAWCLTLAERAGDETLLQNGGTRLDELAPEYANLRSALAWAFAHSHLETGTRLALALGWFWYVRGPVSEGRPWLERVLAEGDAIPVALRVDALLEGSALAHRQRDAAAAATLATEGLALAGAHGDARQIARGQFLLGVAIRMLGNLDWATDLLTAALESFRALGEAVAVGAALKNLGLAAQAAGDRARATSLTEEAVALSRQGRTEWELASAVCCLAGLALEDGRLAHTAALAEEALHLFHAHGDRLTIADVLPRLAAVALHEGQPAAATRLLAATDRIRTDLGVPVSVTDRAAYQNALSASQVALSEDGFSHAWMAGTSSPLNEIVADAFRSPEADPMAPSRDRSRFVAVRRSPAVNSTCCACSRPAGPIARSPRRCSSARGPSWPTSGVSSTSSASARAKPPERSPASTASCDARRRRTADYLRDGSVSA